MRAEGIATNIMETGVPEPSSKCRKESFRSLSRLTTADRSEIRHILYLFAFGSVDFISIRFAWRCPYAFNQNIRIKSSIKHSYAVNIQMVDSEKLSDEFSLLSIAHWLFSSKQRLRSQQSRQSWIKPPTVSQIYWPKWALVDSIRFSAELERSSSGPQAALQMHGKFYTINCKIFFTYSDSKSHISPMHKHCDNNSLWRTTDWVK